MNIHHLSGRDHAGSGPLAVGLNFHHELYDLADTVLKTRAIRAFENVTARYPIHRQVRCAVRRKLEEVFDDLAVQMNLAAARLDEGHLLLDGAGVFVRADGQRKAGYCSCRFSIWADSRARLEQVREQLMHLVGERYARDQMFTIDWHFMDGRSGLSSAAFDELAVDTIYDEAYPSLGTSVAEFVRRYLDAPETVLILQGPPGTGKTRLVRAILGAISARKEDSAQVMYTADKKALENDEIFVSFITGAHDAFVVEDADHLLLTRSNGNHDLHRFLAIADGVVRAQGRKIIFTTNLPNVSDIDAALLRPGRCFANVATRALSVEETSQLVRRIAIDEARGVSALEQLLMTDVRSITIANIYRACAA